MRLSSSFAALMALATVAVSGAGCSSDELGDRIGGAVPIINPNRLPPGRYIQEALSIPTTLDDPLYATAAPWSVSPLSAPMTYLWSYIDIGVEALYPHLTLPANEIIVAVIDTGVDKDHEDLVGRLWVNPVEGTEAAYANGFDDDNDGYVDSFIGWDFVNDTNNPADDSGHGTHVAGTIAAIGGNGLGIVGVAPWVRIMPLKVCNSSGTCRSSDIRAAMAYAVDHGAKIINLSLGAYSRGSDAMAFEAAVNDANDAGVLVIAASGNNAVPASQLTPANTTHAMAVAAYRTDNAICTFSNYGWKVDVAAPGCGLNSGVEVSAVLSPNSRKCGAAGNEICSRNRLVGENYTLKQGTSMATPHVAGMAAVALTASPTATPLQIRQALHRTSRAISAGNRHNDFGSGRISATNLITEAQTAPGLRITSPWYGTSATTHNIGFRIEARANAVSWQLRYASAPSSGNFTLSSGTIIAQSATDVGANTSANFTQSWSPPAAGEYLLILEATAGGETYYDTTLVQR